MPSAQFVATVELENEGTLVADGTADKLDPVANSRRLTNLFLNARLQLYPNAGHAFLFQDEAAFASLMESFLG